jgi:hypothetical protein
VDERRVESVVRESEQNARFADAAVPDEQKFEE